MEFTYQGLIRYGFGFQNPNHAAALITMLLPLCWGGRKLAKKWWILLIIWLIESTLYLGLILTYSRAGVLALCCSGIIFLILSFRFMSTKKSQTVNNLKFLVSKRYIFFYSLFLIFILASFFSGALNRYISIFTPDKAMTNRLYLWKGGLQILAENPNGVGLGNSGIVFTEFYQLPEKHYVYRTMVNSFLTFLVEQGLWMSFVPILLIVCILIATSQSLKKNESLNVKIIFISLISASISVFISGMSSTCFDLSIWKNDFNLNCFLLVVLLCLAIGILLFLGALSLIFYKIKLPLKVLFSSLGLTVFIFLSLFLLGVSLGTERRTTCHIVEKKGFIWAQILPKQDHTKKMLIIPDVNVCGKKELLNFLIQKYPRYSFYFPLKSYDNFNFQWNKIDTILLVGKNICPPNKQNYNDVIFFRPTRPLSHPPSSKIQKVYLEEFDENGYNTDWENIIKNNKIEYIQ